MPKQKDDLPNYEYGAGVFFDRIGNSSALPVNVRPLFKIVLAVVSGKDISEDEKAVLLSEYGSEKLAEWGIKF
jgi:hypothetical protein